MFAILLSLLLQPALTEDSCQPSVQVPSSGGLHICLWDATSRGNEEGHLVVIVQ